MNSPLASRVTAPLDKNKLEQLSYLCALLVGINKACMKREGITYASGSGSKDKTLTEVQKFFSKLALICDTQKGEQGRTVTALVCLRGTEGPEYIFTSNSRKETELRETKSFLSSLLTFVGTNPSKLEPKPLQKQVLWRSLEFNFDKLKCYLDALITALDNCIISESRRGLNGQYNQKPAYDLLLCASIQLIQLTLIDSQTMGQLRLLQDKASFPRDIASSKNARNKGKMPRVILYILDLSYETMLNYSYYLRLAGL